MSYVAVRFGEVEDLSALADIEQAAAKEFLPYAEWLGITPELLEGLVPLNFLRQAQAENRLWIASSDKKVVGFVIIKFLVESCFIVELDVHPRYWRQGIGSALVEACCRHAKACGSTKMLLTTFRQVPWNIPFYQKLDFVSVASEDWSQEIWAIVQHEARYGFPADKRAVMVRSL